MGDKISGIRVKLKDLEKTAKSSADIDNAINTNSKFYVLDWTKKHTNLFAAIQLEKKVMSIILTLIIAVAAFNIVSTLVMGVTEKKSDIAILRTIGASQVSILLFMLQGALTGIIGTSLGVILGICIAANIDIIVPLIESLFNIQFLAKDIYYISEVPSKILRSDIIYISFMGLFLSFVASIYPSIKASKLDPAATLKHE